MIDAWFDDSAENVYGTLGGARSGTGRGGCGAGRTANMGTMRLKLFGKKRAQNGAIIHKLRPLFRTREDDSSMASGSQLSQYPSQSFVANKFY